MEAHLLENERSVQRCLVDSKAFDCSQLLLAHGKRPRYLRRHRVIVHDVRGALGLGLLLDGLAHVDELLRQPGNGQGMSGGEAQRENRERASLEGKKESSEGVELMGGMEEDAREREARGKDFA